MKKISKTLYWAPRILAVMLLLFLTLFSFDVFDSCIGIAECFFAMVLHNIIVFILAILLWLSWKREWIGAITFVVAGLLYISLLVISAIIEKNFEWYLISWSMILAGPAFIIAYLFWKNWKKKVHRTFKNPF